MISEEGLAHALISEGGPAHALISKRVPAHALISEGVPAHALISEEAHALIPATLWSNMVLSFPTMRANKELTSQLVFNNVVMLAQFVFLVVGFLADPLTLQFKFMKPKLLDGQLIVDTLFRFVTTLCLVCSSRSGATNARDPIFSSGPPIKAITSGRPSVPIIKRGTKNACKAMST